MCQGNINHIDSGASWHWLKRQNRCLSPRWDQPAFHLTAMSLNQYITTPLRPHVLCNTLIVRGLYFPLFAPLIWGFLPGHTKLLCEREVWVQNQLCCCASSNGVQGHSDITSSRIDFLFQVSSIKTLKNQNRFKVVILIRAI